MAEIKVTVVEENGRITVTALLMDGEKELSSCILTGSKNAKYINGHIRYGDRLFDVIYRNNEKTGLTVDVAEKYVSDLQFHSAGFVGDSPVGASIPIQLGETISIELVEPPEKEKTWRERLRASAMGDPTLEAAMFQRGLDIPPVAPMPAEQMSPKDRTND